MIRLITMIRRGTTMRLVLHLGACCIVVLCAIPWAVASPPNIVLILADDMGYGDPGCYNSESKIATPSIDRIAREGVRFTDAHSPESYCIPTRYGLLTGRYPFRVNLQIEKQPGIEAGRVTLPSMLRDHGYRTAMVGKWHLGFEGGQQQPFTGELRGGPMDRGFESYFGIHASLDIPPYFYIRDRHAAPAPTEHIDASATEGWSRIQGAFWREGLIAPGFRHEEVLPRFEEECLTFLQQQTSEQPFFLYAALPAPHTPWLPLESFRGRSGAGIYGDFAMQVDALVGRLLEKLDEKGLADNTFVVFTSDNGPVWYETDNERFGHRATGPYRGMKADSFEGGHRMPLIVRWPGHAAEGQVCHSLVGHTDLLATCAEIIGVPAPPEIDSVSIVPALTHPTDHPRLRETLIIRRTGAVIRLGDWKLINHLGSGGFTEPRQVEAEPDGPQVQLYNLRDDPSETNNLALQRQDMVAQLLAIRSLYGLDY